MRSTLIAALLMALFPCAWSQETRDKYVGAAFGKANIQNACQGTPSSLSCDADENGVRRFFGGFQFTRNIALELGYSTLGAVRASSGENADLSAFDLSAVGSWPLTDRFAAYGRLGIYHGEHDVSPHAVPAIFPPPPTMGWTDRSSTGAMFGLGARYDVTEAAALRGEWQRFRNFEGGQGAKLDIDVLSIGALLRFR